MSELDEHDLRTFLIALVFRAPGSSVELSDDDIYNAWMNTETGFPRAARWERTGSGVRISVDPPRGATS